MSTFALDRVTAQFPEAVAERYLDRTGGDWAVIHAEHLPKVAAFLKNDLDFKLFTSIDAVDRLHLAENDPRFEVVYFIYSLSRHEHVRLKVRVSEAKPGAPLHHAHLQGRQLVGALRVGLLRHPLHGHPDLRRVLLYEEFQGHPLRKDYPLRDRQPLIPERPIKDIFRGPGTSGVQLSARPHRTAPRGHDHGGSPQARVTPSPEAPNPDIDAYAHEAELEAHLQTKRMFVNLGPSHPAMHGTVRMKVELEGETIAKSDCEIGFLHRGFQKSCENVTWTQCLPYIDRLNYVSAMMNNFGFLNAVEKLIGLEIPERASTSASSAPSCTASQTT